MSHRVASFLRWSCLAWMLVSLTALCSARPLPMRFNVRAYGATGDGRTKDTAAIARAIEACTAAGGGVVEFPAGRYLTGTIRLRSHVTLHVGPGAVILGSPDVADYPVIPNPWGEKDWQGPTQLSGLIYAEGAEHIAIEGDGTIDGQGLIWWKRQWYTDAKSKAKRDTSGVDPADVAYLKQHGGRPRLIRLVECRHVRIADVTLRNSPRWTVHPTFCDYVNIAGVTILNPESAPNTDGINPESCRFVHIADCHIDTGDDGITLKSGHNEVGRRKARPTENVTIANCTFVHAHGGIVIGSEMSGDVRNVTATNCVFKGTEKGIRIKSNRERGGVVERIRISNLAMQDVVEAINIVTFYYSSDTPDQTFPVGEGTPRFRDIHISDVVARGSRRAGQIAGLREMPIGQISLRNVRISAAAGFTVQDAEKIQLEDVHLDVKSGPALQITRGAELEIDGLRVSRAAADTPAVDLSDVRALRLRDARAPQGTGVFLRVGGIGSAEVDLVGCDLRHARERVALRDGARPESVTVRD